MSYVANKELRDPCADPNAASITLRDGSHFDIDFDTSSWVEVLRSSAGRLKSEEKTHAEREGDIVRLWTREPRDGVWVDVLEEEWHLGGVGFTVWYRKQRGGPLEVENGRVVRDAKGNVLSADQRPAVPKFTPCPRHMFNFEKAAVDFLGGWQNAQWGTEHKGYYVTNGWMPLRPKESCSVIPARWVFQFGTTKGEITHGPFDLVYLFSDGRTEGMNYANIYNAKRSGDRIELTYASDYDVSVLVEGGAIETLGFRIIDENTIEVEDGKLRSKWLADEEKPQPDVKLLKRCSMTGPVSREGAQ